jgi:hypothetical protein
MFPAGKIVLVENWGKGWRLNAQLRGRGTKTRSWMKETSFDFRIVTFITIVLSSI